MEYMEHFSIPFKGLNDGDHRFQFEIDKSFFLHFKNDMVQDGNMQVIFDLDKKPGVSTMQFDIKGSIFTDCDRCMEKISMVIDRHFSMLLKYGEEEEGNEDVMYIDPDLSHLNVGQIIYEFIILSIPMIKTCDDEFIESKTCNQEVLKRLENDQNNTGSSGIWDSLKGIKFENN